VKPRDAGYSLIEVMMAMVCMSILMTVVTGSIIQIYHSVDGVDAIAAAQSQVDTTFARLDKEVRYARGISNPGVVNGDAYVEYLLTVDATDTCVELRLHTGALQRRQWPASRTPPAPTGWQTLASSVTAGTPFAVTAPDTDTLTGFRYQRLTLDVTAVTGGAGVASHRETAVTFTALNATGTDNSTTCTSARGIAS
jgi:prepilin-type N-terminal cleavage/methylation domain-containing protein